MKHGLILPNWLVGSHAAQLVDYAVLAEESEWDGVFLADHLVFPPPPTLDPKSGGGSDLWSPPQYMNFPDPWITLAGIAVSTETITLGSWITPIPRRQPWQFARDLATLDRLSNGRVILGTGLGRRSEYERFGIPWEPRKLSTKYDEALEIINGLWSGARFSFTGEHYAIDDVAVLPTPVQQPRIPVIIGGIWPSKRPFQRGARWDGIVPHYPGDGVVPAQGAIRPEVVIREMLGYYHSLTDYPGEIFLPADPPGKSSEYEDVCTELGVTWLYSILRDDSGEWVLDEDQIREGPQR